MIEFDLDEVFAKEKPVKLRNGEKAFIIYKYSENLVNDKGNPNMHPYIGYSLDKNNHATFDIHWHKNGICSNYISDYDIIGEWKDPINPEDLPKPFIPCEDEPYYYIYGGVVNYESEYWKSNDFDRCSAKNGQCFRTEEDAQVWLDFMKSKLE